MKSMIKQLLGSKKAWATAVSIIVWLGGRLSLDISPELLLPVVGSLAAFVLGQGWADSGKESKKLELAAAGEPEFMKESPDGKTVVELAREATDAAKDSRD